MDKRIQKVFEGLFTLEEIREIFRQSVPTGLDNGEEAALLTKIHDLRAIISELELQTGSPRVTKIAGTLDVRCREENFINIHPIQAAGRLTPEARKALISYGDGYSTCDTCRKPFRLDKITKPPIAGFHEELAKFLHMDQARVVPGARRGFQAVTGSIVEKGDSVIVSALAHYTEFLAVENAGGVVKEVPVSPSNTVTAEATAAKIEEVKQETGTLPVLVMIDHFDYQFANEHDVRGIAKVAHQYDIPFLYNGAYTVGVMPVNGKEIGADFVVGSGHKSMASVAPSGVLAATDEYAGKVFRTTQMLGDVTKPEVRDQGGRDARLHAHGRHAPLHDGLVPDRQGTNAPLGGRGEAIESLHRCTPEDRGEQSPLRVPEEAYAHESGYDRQASTRSRRPTSAGVSTSATNLRSGE